LKEELEQEGREEAYKAEEEACEEAGGKEHIVFGELQITGVGQRRVDYDSRKGCRDCAVTWI
jgi:hypothetical protein